LYINTRKPNKTANTIEIIYSSDFASRIFFISCKRNLVNLDYTNAKDEVALLENLVFRFDKTLIADSLLNHWDSTKYVSFEPVINGKFRWEHSDELIFSPSSGCRIILKIILDKLFWFQNPN
jgi:hypothetical protein